MEKTEERYSLEQVGSQGGGGVWAGPQAQGEVFASEGRSRPPL